MQTVASIIICVFLEGQLKTDVGACSLKANMILYKFLPIPKIYSNGIGTDYLSLYCILMVIIPAPLALPPVLAYSALCLDDPFPEPVVEALSTVCTYSQLSYENP